MTLTVDERERLVRELDHAGWVLAADDPAALRRVWPAIYDTACRRAGIASDRVGDGELRGIVRDLATTPHWRGLAHDRAAAIPETGAAPPADREGTVRRVLRIDAREGPHGVLTPDAEGHLVISGGGDAARTRAELPWAVRVEILAGTPRASAVALLRKAAAWLETDTGAVLDATAEEGRRD